LGGESRNTRKILLGIPIHYVCLEAAGREEIVILRRDKKVIVYQMWLQELNSFTMVYFIISDLEI